MRLQSRNPAHTATTSSIRSHTGVATIAVVPRRPPLGVSVSMAGTVMGPQNVTPFAPLAALNHASSATLTAGSGYGESCVPLASTALTA